MKSFESVLEAVRARAYDSEEEAKNARKKIASLEKVLKRRGKLKLLQKEDGSVVYTGKSVEELKRENTKLREEVVFLSSSHPERLEKLRARNRNKDLF